MATASNPTPSLRAQAVALAERGFCVFPLIQNGKTPRDKRFYEIATDDPARAHDLWTDAVTGWPRPWNIGLLTGNGIAAIDVDCKGGKPGMSSMARLDLPLGTLTVRTPSGGLHLLYRTPHDVANVSDSDKAPSPLGRGIDVRGHHGYVVAAGSVIDGVAYVIEHDATLAEMPAHVLERLAAPRERAETAAVPACDLDSEFAVARAARYLAEEAPVAIEGSGGDDTTFRVAATVKDMGLSAAMALDLMAEHYNDRCSPPWDLDELQGKVDNAFAYGLSPAGSKSPSVDFAGMGEIIPPPPAAPVSVSRIRFLSDADAAVRPAWLVKGWLPKQGVALLAGQSRIGKTFLSLELAGALATGGTFFGRQVRERVGVLILAAEGEGTIAPRLEALRLHRLGGLPVADLPIGFVGINDANEIGAVVTAAAAQMQERFGLRLGMVAVDTVAAAFGADENDAQVATAAMKALGKLAADAECLVVAVAHYGKSDGAGVRGSSAWTASADVILAATGEISEISGEVRDRKVALTKSRFAETGPIADFDLRSVNLGFDEDGDPISAAVVSAENRAEADPNLTLYLDGLDGLLRAAGEAIGDGRRGVPRKLLREHCYGEWIDIAPKAKTKRFDRLEKRLVDTRQIERCFGPGGVEFVALPPPINPASLF